MTQKTSAIIGAGLALLAVAFGALGAHFLKAHLDASQLDSFKTGVRYQMYHALAILLCYLIMLHDKGSLILISQRLFIIGTICFSGSIYLLSTTPLSGLSVGFLGPITPLGGLLLMAGWAILALHFIKNKNHKDD